jgi:hypothetical protein
LYPYKVKAGATTRAMIAMRKALPLKPKRKFEEDILGGSNWLKA